MIKRQSWMIKILTYLFLLLLFTIFSVPGTIIPKTHWKMYYFIAILHLRKLN